MPQASDELRAKMKEYFGDPIDDLGPSQYLRSRGYREVANGLWRRPSESHTITAKEQNCFNFLDTVTQKDRECLNFLVDEWDHEYDLTRDDK